MIVFDFVRVKINNMNLGTNYSYKIKNSNKILRLCQ